ncbi:carboxypeptidase-like regulatory domain-containing protein [Paradesertivirga mongoliensis]|uniref:Carboxypeptidase-like regulatory domain-containing protein n=1 Tax=Paradesertivirga mongoliensis TaxID=2100740 RepID=A0ABW4ZHB7_9SPHI|nr:carboxypeptidase-like regulatory domain-containing protein [Pedobacter mongoliensis]
MKHLLSILIFLFALTGISRGQDRPIVQFSGVIYNVDSNVVVPYVSVTNMTDKRKVVSANHQGYFSFVAHEGDTIVFSAIGYRREALVIPRNTDKRYTVIIKMKAEAINLPMVRVLPWASLDDFNRAFMSMKFADDDLEIAKKNVARTSILAMAKTLPRDAIEMNGLNFQNNHIALSNKNMNMQGANALTNPFAWGALIQQIMRGDKSRSNN